MKAGEKNMKKSLSFEDCLMVPRFSTIKSRADVSLIQTFLGMKLDLPFISSNMDSVTGSKMANAMRENGALGALHRFCTIEENVKMFIESPKDTIVSIGLGDKELDRAVELYNNGAANFLIDVAHGASMEVVKQFKKLRNITDYTVNIIVGNFATGQSIQDFKHHLGMHSNGLYAPDAYKVGIGGGAICLTRVVTGCGMPTFASILDCATTGEVIIADGGIRNSGDAIKALAAGADLIMCGKMFAGTDESPGEICDKEGNDSSWENPYVNSSREKFKKYRGSASQESYEVQNKVATHRAPEGDSYLVPYVGPVKNVLDNLSAGIKSGCSYLGADNLRSLREVAEFIEITSNGVKENGPHGK